MSDSVFTGSVVVGGEVAAGGVELVLLVELPVDPYAGGEGQDALADAYPDSFGDMAAVVLERELAFEGVVDRLDPLADPAERSEALALILAIGADEGGVVGRRPRCRSHPSQRSVRSRARAQPRAALARSGTG